MRSEKSIVGGGIVRRVRNLSIVVILIVALPIVFDGVEASHGSKNCTEPRESRHGTHFAEIYCPPPTPRGASCIAYGILVVEQDNAGALGDAVAGFSRSRAWTRAIPGEWTPVPPPGRDRPIPPPRPPTDPTAHADANQVGVSYRNAGAGSMVLQSSTVFSRCDVVALTNRLGLYTEAYGRAGVEDFKLEVQSLGLQIRAEVLDFEIGAIGQPSSTFAVAACDVVELGVTPPDLVLSYCPPPNTGPSTPVVTVHVNEEWGPVSNAAVAQWIYGGAALHVTVSSPLSTVDVYVGYVAVAVSGGGPLPIFWSSDNVCTLVVCPL